MDPRVNAAIIAGLFGLIGALIALIGTLVTVWAKCPKLFIKGSGQLGETVFKWMGLPKGAQKKLARSQFIRIGETGHALMTLVNSANENDSILAICGYKGSYATEYYRKNFEKCKAVSRVFSYEAICSEITVKKEHYALDGFKMHLKEEESGNRNVEVILIKKGRFIKDMTGGNFDPPLSFGLAILRDGNNSPKKAVVHWEMDAEPLKHLIAIEGVIIDHEQQEVLRELVKLREAIDRSHHVLSSKKDKDKNTITALCTELEEFCEISMSH